VTLSTRAKAKSPSSVTQRNRAARNVEALQRTAGGYFQKAVFALERIVECHGSIHHFQCVGSCSDEIWEADHETVNINEDTFRAFEPLPKCRNCPALARPNILMFGDWSWLGHRTEAQQERFSKWLNELDKSSAKLAVVELGAGSAIPTVRYTSERVVERLGGTLIRINPREHEVPGGHIGLPFGAAEGIGRICHGAENLAAETKVIESE
jgi:NAD-dependent SIR2 family protein deacetylase